MNEVEIQDLKNKVQNLEEQTKGLNAAINAHKEMINEYVGNILNLKTNLMLYQQAYNELAAKNGDLNKELELKNSQNSVLVKKLSDHVQDLQNQQAEDDAA